MKPPIPLRKQYKSNTLMEASELFKEELLVESSSSVFISAFFSSASLSLATTSTFLAPDLSSPQDIKVKMVNHKIVNICILSFIILNLLCQLTMNANVLQICDGGAFQLYRLFEKLDFNYTKKLSRGALHSRLRQAAVYALAFCRLRLQTA